MKAKNKIKPPIFTPNYSWHPKRRASKECIKHFIAEAVRNKEWAQNVTPGWRKAASIMSNEMADAYLRKTIHEMAKSSLNYIRMRAWLGVGEGGNGWPWDRPARELWLKLNPDHKEKS